MKYKIFVSGVQKELKEERFAVKSLIAENVLLNEYFRVFLFEESPAKSRSAKTAYLDEVRKSDIYLGILGNEYGTMNKDNLSATELEFREAKKKDKEMLIFIKSKDTARRDGRVRKLINEIRDSEEGYVYKRFKTIPEFKNSVYESLIDFLRERGIVGRERFDSAVCEEAILKDIDEDKVRLFMQAARQHRNFPLNLNAPIRDIFTHLNLLKSGKPTNAAILLFGKRPERFFLQAEVKCLHLHGTEMEKPFESYHIFKGSLFDQIDSALGFVLDRLRRPVIPEPGRAATSRPYEIPEFVIREAIVNAVAHRDYNSSASVQVNVFIDRIEIWNPGRLPSQLTIELLKKPHPSFPQNPLLCEPFYLSGYIERAGSGTLEMIKQCRNRGLPEPDFMQKMGHFITTIWKDIFTEKYLLELGLNERQLKAVKYVKEKGRITNKEYQELFDIKKRQATDDLKKLKNRGIFDRIGMTGKGTYYILKGRQRGERGTKGAPKGIV
jgi:predicted HTH transcriptional regulator